MRCNFVETVLDPLDLVCNLVGVVADPVFGPVVVMVGNSEEP